MKRTSLTVGLAGLAFLALSGCATAPPRTDAEAYADFKRDNDPFRPTNEVIFATTMRIDKYVIRPVAKTYVKVVPEGGRRSVSNFLDNLYHPFIAANDILQGKPSKASTAVWRFLINSTIGIGGLFDPATKMGLERHDEDFGQTLAVWGVPEGPYVVLPILGPSNPRDMAGLVTDFFFDPMGIAIDKADVANIGNSDISALTVARRGLDSLDFRARNDAAFDELHDSADPYVLARSVYRQNRNFEIADGELETSQEEEDIFDEEFDELLEDENEDSGSGDEDADPPAVENKNND